MRIRSIQINYHNYKFFYHLRIDRALIVIVNQIRSRERGDRSIATYHLTMADFVKEVDWESFKPWLVPAAGAVVAAYLLYKVVRIARADCDLTLLSRRLKAGYFTDKVVWVTGASSGSTFIFCIAVSSPLDYQIYSPVSGQGILELAETIHRYRIPILLSNASSA